MDATTAMPTLTTDDGVALYYEDTGQGTPIVFAHEFAGDHRSWEPQVRHFSRRYRCITYCARGYPPSDVPADPGHYSQARACEDLRCVLDSLGLERAHILGLSMGGFASLHFAMAHGARTLSAVVAGCGWGAELSTYSEFQAQSRANAAALLSQGMPTFAAGYAAGATRVQYQHADPRGFAEFLEQFAGHSALGSANTQIGVQARRPSLYHLTEEMARIQRPVLVIAGDEDEATLEPGLLMKRTIPGAGLVVLPNSGHMLNLENPALFNHLVEDFFRQVEAGRWRCHPSTKARARAGG